MRWKLDLMPHAFQRGRRFAFVLAVLAIGRAPAVAQQPPSPQPEIHRVLVVPVNLRGRAPLGIDRQQIARALYGATDSVAARYRAISYGQIDFRGSANDVVDPVTLSEPVDLCTTGLGHLADTAEDAVRQRGVALDAYQHVVFVLPKDTPCSWVGLGAIGGKRVWVKATTAKALQHELGHNLGMNHAVTWHGGAAEDSDFMGAGSTSLNAPHVIEMGWLKSDPGKVIEITTAGDVTLEALEADPHQSKLPKVAILRPATGGNIYYLSYRAASAANPLPAPFTQGVNLHIFNDASHSEGRGGGLTYFVASLADGASYSDGPMIVQQVSHVAGEHVTLHISFDGKGQAIPGGPPPAPPGTVQSLATGKCLDLPGGQSSDGTSPIQYDCHGGPNQQWRIEAVDESKDNDGYRIVSNLSGKCIGTGPASGDPVRQARCTDAADQLWRLENAGAGDVLRNQASRLCLDVPGGSQSNGAQPIAWTCNGGTNQIWRYLSPTTP